MVGESDVKGGMWISYGGLAGEERGAKRVHNAARGGRCGAEGQCEMRSAKGERGDWGVEFLQRGKSKRIGRGGEKEGRLLGFGGFLGKSAKEFEICRKGAHGNVRET